VVVARWEGELDTGRLQQQLDAGPAADGLELLPEPLLEPGQVAGLEPGPVPARA